MVALLVMKVSIRSTDGPYCELVESSLYPYIQTLEGQFHKILM
jgi:hypothetical protein